MDIITIFIKIWIDTMNKLFEFELDTWQEYTTKYEYGFLHGYVDGCLLASRST